MKIKIICFPWALLCPRKISEFEKKKKKFASDPDLEHRHFEVMKDAFLEINRLFRDQIPALKSLFFSFEVTRSCNDHALYHKTFKELYRFFLLLLFC